MGVGAHHQRNNSGRRLSSSGEVLVEHQQLPSPPRQQQQHLRPRMGTKKPFVTSTPQQQQQHRQEQKKPHSKTAPIAEEEETRDVPACDNEEEEEEPIYCEISRGDASPLRLPAAVSAAAPPTIKAPLVPPANDPASSSSSSFARGGVYNGSGRRRSRQVDRQARRQAGLGLAVDLAGMRIQQQQQQPQQQQQQREEKSKRDMLLQRRSNSSHGGSSNNGSNRKSCDLSRQVLKEEDTASEVRLPNLYYGATRSKAAVAPGLGRRAATQVDMAVGAGTAAAGRNRIALRRLQQQTHLQQQQQRYYQQQVSLSRRNLMANGQAPSDTESVRSHPMGIHPAAAGRQVRNKVEKKMFFHVVLIERNACGKVAFRCGDSLRVFGTCMSGGASEKEGERPRRPAVQFSLEKEEAKEIGNVFARHVSPLPSYHSKPTVPVVPCFLFIGRRKCL